MPREIPEWRGKTDDTPAPTRVRLRVFDAHGGKCAECGMKLGPATPWDLDHTVALVNGGENAEGNLRPLCKPCHRGKSAEDVAQKAKDRRVRSKHIGAAPKKRKMPYRRFNGDPVWRD